MLFIFMKKKWGKVSHMYDSAKIHLLFLNFFLTIFAFLLFSLFVPKQTFALNPDRTNIMDTIPKNYLALGDSYTIGESVAEEKRFPVQTVKMLRDSGVFVNDADIIATTGWTTRDLLNAIELSTTLPVYDVVTLLIGVNNQYQGKNITDYKKEFSEIIKKAIHFAGEDPQHVIVLSIPDYSVTPFALTSDTQKIAREIDNFNAINKEIALAEGACYIDITGISRQKKDHHLLIAADGLHPSALQYVKWSSLLKEMIFTIFKNEREK